MRHWTDWLFAIFHLCTFAGWLGYRSGCWAWDKPAEYFKPWALRELKRSSVLHGHPSLKEYFDPDDYYEGSTLEKD